MKRFSVLLITLVLIFALFGCGESDIPQGMQVVRADEGLGYYMYAPEEWTVSNIGEVSNVYASRVDLSSVSYTEIEKPKGPSRDGFAGTEGDYFLALAKGYFEDSKKEFPAQPKVTLNGEACEFGSSEGAADYAVKFIYEYEYEGYHFRIMQIFVGYGERFGIFTYTASIDTGASETTKYDSYLEKVTSIIDNFRFVGKKGGNAEDEAVRDEDGYRLVSDKSLAKFELYLPDSFKTNYASGIVSASTSDGSTLTLSIARETGNISVKDYFENRTEALCAIVTDYKLIEETKSTTLGNAKQAAAYEYSYSYNGKTYHVYQIFGVTTFNGFVLTYTATEENYAKHMEEIKAIAERIVF